MIKPNRSCGFCLLLTITFAQVAARAFADITYSRPDPAATGGISGVIKSSDKLQAVIALEPFELKVYRAAIDTSTKQFLFDGLPPGEYDLMVKTEGHVYEGLTLKPVEEPALRGKPLQAICDDICTEYFKTEDYFNMKQIVRLSGTKEAARLFAVQTRTMAVVDPGGTRIHAQIRRFDFVDLVKTRQVWQITTSRHLLRQEVPYRSKDIKIQFLHSPKLAGVLVGESVKQFGTIKLKTLAKSPPGQYAGATHGRRATPGR